MLAVFDIDGVVADVGHRVHLIERNRWHAFFAAADRDPLLVEGARLVADLAREHEIVWLTGRPEWLRGVTADWLAHHDLPGEELHMRPDGDFRPAARYKLDVLRRLRRRGVAAVVDDDELVIDAARDAGFPAVRADWAEHDRRGARALRRAQEREGRT